MTARTIRVYRDTSITELSRCGSTEAAPALRVVRFGGDLVAVIVGNLTISINEVLNGAELVEVVNERTASAGDSWLAIFNRGAGQWVVFSNGAFVEFVAGHRLAERLRRMLEL